MVQLAVRNMMVLLCDRQKVCPLWETLTFNAQMSFYTIFLVVHTIYTASYSIEIDSDKDRETTMTEYIILHTIHGLTPLATVH